MIFTVPQMGLGAGGKCPFYCFRDWGICTFLESNRALHSWGTACDLQPTQMRAQLKEGVMCRARPSLSETRGEFSTNPKGLYRHCCNMENCWMEAKRKRNVLPYIGNQGDFSTDQFILTSHVRLSCLTSPPLLVTAGDTLRTACCGPRMWLSTMLCNHIHASETSERSSSSPGCLLTVQQYLCMHTASFMSV